MGQITLTDGTTTIALPEDLRWIDEHTWSPVEQSVGYSLGGSLVVEIGTRLAGRPVTLAGDNDRAWITRTVLDQLYAWASVAGKTLTLTLADARVFSVMFRHHDGALQAEPVMFSVPAQSGDFFIVTLRLMQV